jgi:HEPN domain-containing protein
LIKEDLIKYWIQSSDDDYVTMKNLYKSKDYVWTLFMGHLVIEKLLKAYYVKIIDEDVPFIHDLLRIAKKIGIEMNEEQMDIFDEITTFNIKARYDDYKQSFRNVCNSEFVKQKVSMIKEVRECLKKMLKK